MEWKELYPQDNMPTIEDMADFIGGDMKSLWMQLMTKFSIEFKIKPKLTYSVCSGKPGWNVKLQKNSKTYGTLYPEQNSFSVFLVISYKLDNEMQKLLTQLSTELAEMYLQAGDYMKVGKWLMFRITDQKGVTDYLNIVQMKMLAG